MKVIILAGGKGSRMGDITREVPKPMVRIAGNPILEHQIDLVKRFNLKELIILTGYKGEVIENHFGDGKEWGVNITYRREATPLGTAGAVKEIEDCLDDDALVLYGDIIMDIDLDLFRSYHSAKRPIATIVAHPNDHPYDSDILDITDDNRVIAFHNKPHEKNILRNLVNAAMYIISPKIMNYIPGGSFSDFAKDIFPKLIISNEPVYAYNTPEYIKDIGTVERLKEVEADMLSGKIRRLNKKNRRKAVFIDRDGVINYESELLNTGGFELYPETPESIKKINKSEYLAVIVTNQPAVAKGFITIGELNAVHAMMETLLAYDGAYIDRTYYCPHHPDRGFEGEVPEYKTECDCRKPRTGLIDRAIKELNIDIGCSYMIGDRTVDIMTGINAGLKTILVRTGYAGKDGKYRCEPDFTFENLREAVDFVIGEGEFLTNSMARGALK